MCRVGCGLCVMGLAIGSGAVSRFGSCYGLGDLFKGVKRSEHRCGTYVH